jgi:hypothetical protein
MNEVIRFENLRQRTSVVGEYAEVTAKAKPFVSENAHGILRKVGGHKDVAILAAKAGGKTRALLLRAE